MSLYFALPGALSYGLADFAGGLATRRAPVFVVTAVVQVAGLVALLPAMPIAGGTLSWAAVGWGVLAAAGGTGGLLLYLRALAVGPMGVVAPLSAVVGAGLPLLVGLLGGERLGPVTLVAIGIALVAIVLATAGGKAGTGGRIGPLMALGAGAGFALFFVGLHAAPTDSGMWPLLVGRLASAPALVVVAALIGGLRPGAGFPWKLAVFSGVFDTLANVFFLLATRSGDLGVSSVVVSLYPVVVALLAGVVLRERLTALQIGAGGPRGGRERAAGAHPSCGGPASDQGQAGGLPDLRIPDPARSDHGRRPPPVAAADSSRLHVLTSVGWMALAVVLLALLVLARTDGGATAFARRRWPPTSTSPCSRRWPTRRRPRG